MSDKVDVVINVFGKPWQTLCSLKSLLKHSGDKIDKIYFIEERQQPYGDNVSWVVDQFDNIEHFIPDVYSFIPNSNTFGDLNNPRNRYNFRYQYGIEKSDKRHVFLLHNDILFTGDIIGDMLSEIDDSIGCGMIGQCWNCPAFKAGLCDGSKFYAYSPTYNDIITLSKDPRYIPGRYTQFSDMIDKNRPMPLPECRLNEFACLLNRELVNKACFPNGTARLFGCYDILDLGDAWFRDVILEGYHVKNYDINKTSIHGFYSRIPQEIREYSGSEDSREMYVSGYPTQLDHLKYCKSELFAKDYYEKNYAK